MQDGALDLPGVFAERDVPLDRLDARLDLEDRGRAPGPRRRASPSRWPAHLRQCRRAGRAERDLAHRRRRRLWRAAAAFRASSSSTARSPTRVAARTARYLPLGLPEGVRNYVAAPVRAGTIPSATFRVRGDLWDFPFHDAKASARRRVPHRGQGRGPDLRLCPRRRRQQRRRAPPARRRRRESLAAAHGGGGRAGRRPFVARDPQRQGAARRRRMERRAGPHRRARQHGRGSTRRQRARRRSPTCCATSTPRRSAAGPAARWPRRRRPARPSSSSRSAMPLARAARHGRQGQPRAWPATTSA